MPSTQEVRDHGTRWVGTALRPAGIAEFDGVKLNVVSDGDFVAAQRPIRVERVEGNRIVVREIGRA